VRHWGKGFAKVSANEFFKAVDMNRDGAITFEEFKTFWQVVKNAGHSE
jgi:Ca2+-binding EF-hand superfamily protein